MGLQREILVALADGAATAHGVLHRLRARLGPARPFGAAQVAATLARLERGGFVGSHIVRAASRNLRRWTLTAAGLEERDARELAPTNIALDEYEFVARVVLLAEAGDVDALGRALAAARRDLEGWRLALGRFAAGPLPRPRAGDPAGSRPLSQHGFDLLLALAAADLAWLDDVAAALQPLAEARRNEGTWPGCGSAGARRPRAPVSCPGCGSAGARPTAAVDR